MVRVGLSLGSNIRRYYHLNAAITALESHFGRVICSPVYESAAVGFDGSAFLNSIVLVETEQSLPDVIQVLKGIEDANGRDRTGPKFSPRTLDIDVVTYGNLAGEHEGIELPRPELFKNAFVLQPFADICPEDRVPGRSETFAELWQQQGDQGQQLHQVRFRREP